MLKKSAINVNRHLNFKICKLSFRAIAHKAIHFSLVAQRLPYSACGNVAETANKPNDATEKKIAHNIFAGVERVWFRRTDDVSFDCRNVATELKSDNLKRMTISHG